MPLDKSQKLTPVHAERQQELMQYIIDKREFEQSLQITIGVACAVLLFLIVWKRRALKRILIRLSALLLKLFRRSRQGARVVLEEIKTEADR